MEHISGIQVFCVILFPYFKYMYMYVVSLYFKCVMTSRCTASEFYICSDLYFQYCYEKFVQKNLSYTYLVKYTNNKNILIYLHKTKIVSSNITVW
jgi:hypothetical protein